MYRKRLHSSRKRGRNLCAADQPPAIYEDDQRFGQIVGTFSALAILLACPGLFGLASLSAEKRVREIGIRKTLGASSQSILVLVSAEFVKLVAVGYLIVWPVAYAFTQRWLESFAYRTAIDPLIFLGAALVPC